jgi:preprotein translocase subunit SecD
MSNQQMGLNIDIKNTKSIVSEDGNQVFAEGVILRRVSKFISGTSEDGVIPIPCFYDVKTGRILVELPGAKDVDRIKKLLQSTAQLEFWETHKFEEVAPFLGQLNEALKATEVKVDTKETTSTGIDSLLTDA